MRPEFKDLPPGVSASLERDARRLEAEAEASADPLPGPLMGAFGIIPQEIAGLKIRPIVHYDFVILRQLDSPLLHHLRKLAAGTAPNDGAAAETKYADEDGYEMVYQFTRPARQVAADLARGREEFRNLATEAIGMQLGPVEVNLLIAGIGKELVRYFSTIIKYAPKEAEGEQVFTTPPPAPQTASVGGSTICAG